MSDKDKIEVIFKILVIMELAMIILLTMKMNILFKAKDNLNERIKQLEIDYKIYDMNLKQLQENKEVQFE